MDPTVERLRVCVEQGIEIHTDEDGFWLGDDFLLPKVRGSCSFVFASAHRLLSCHPVFLLSATAVLKQLDLGPAGSSCVSHHYRPVPAVPTTPVAAAAGRLNDRS